MSCMSEPGLRLGDASIRPGGKANAADGAARLVERRRRLFLSLAAVAVFVFYILAVPYKDWVGVLPRDDWAERVPGWPGAEAQGADADVLKDVHVQFSQTWRSGVNRRRPAALYAAPGLTTQQEARYGHLRIPPEPASPLTRKDSKAAGKYMFVAALHDVGDQLPDLINALSVVTAFLGPERVSFSILEGPSADPTPYILDEVLRPMLLRLGVPSAAINIQINAPPIDWDKVNRIEALAELRNKALQPLWDDNKPNAPGGSTVGRDVVAIVYFDNVFLHAADVLELLHQHFASSRGLGTGITAAWDWMPGDKEYFNDVWVARTMDGELFYPIAGPSFAPSDELFPTSPVARDKFATLSPFQVFSAWNGMAVLNPAPFLRGVAFRRANAPRGECFASERSLLASDFWRASYGRVQVVPAVQLAYDRPRAFAAASKLRETMLQLGWESGVPRPEFDKAVTFAKEPPRKVRCNPWPEKTGLGHNVWDRIEWVLPFLL